MSGLWYFARPVRAIMVVALLACSGSGGALAATPASYRASYRVQLAATGDAALDQALQASSNLITLAARAPVRGFALLSRARGDLPRLQTALASQGYYAGRVTITVAGQDISTAALPEEDDQARGIIAPGIIAIAIKIDTGPLFRLGRVTLNGAVPANVRALLPPLAPGAPAVAAAILAAQSRLLNGLREDSYPFASVTAPIATEIAGAHRIDVEFTAATGPKLRLGPISLAGLRGVDQGVDPAYVRRRLRLHPGDPFSPAKIDAARQDLIATGLFSEVTVQPGTPAGGALPLRFGFAVAKQHLVSFSASYSTDLGGAAGVTWSNLNVLGAGEQLNLHAKLTDLYGSATKAPGYDVGAQWLIPDYRQRDQSLSFDLDGFREYLDAYDRTGATLGTTLKRQLAPRLRGQAGITSTTESVTQEGATTRYELVALPLALNFDASDAPLDPTRGFRAALAMTPTYAFGRTGVPYLVLQASGSAYVRLDANGHSVLALRGLAGSADGASLRDLPPDGRFYGGGSATVRGYRYQSIGPRFADGNPAGGLAIDAATVELRQHLGGSFSGVVFVDGGQVSAGTAPFAGAPRFGAGAGVRYASAIGPLRLDIATPLNPQHGDAVVQLYLGIGQAF